MKRLALGAAALALLLALGAGAAWQSMQRYLDAPMPIDAPQSLTIPSGATLSQVLSTLEARGVVTAPHWLRLDARLNDTAGRIHAGDYTLPPGMTPRQMMQAFVAGAVDLERVTLIEGWTAADAVRAIVTHPAVRDDLAVNIETRADGAPWLDGAAHRALAERLSIAQPSIEGWLYPDTYRFARGTAASKLLLQAHRRMRDALDAAWSAAGSDTAPIQSPYQALVLASIIEKETALDDERGRIAGVFTRRLQRGMRLQTDPTVIYGLGPAYDGDIRRRDLQQHTPYNTYRIDGLPPTPIALPGRASIDAALAPVDDDALYFVATGEGDGSHYFSASVEEHNAAVARYLKRLRSRPQ